MISPKEKAIELIFKFWKQGDVTNEQAKPCALICVDEIIASNPYFFYPNRKVTRVSDHSMKEYWQSVRKEIEQL